MKTESKNNEWQHFYLELSDRFIYKGNQSIGEIKGSIEIQETYLRDLEEITEDSLLTVWNLYLRIHCIKKNGKIH